MHITIVGYGTWGDVLPSLALGLGLKQAGFGVQLMITRDFEPWARDRGLDIVPLSVDKRLAMRQVSSETHPLSILLGIRRSIAPGLRSIGHQLLAIADQTDVLLVNEWLLLAASGIAQAHNLRLIHMVQQPAIATAALPIATLPAWPAWAPFESVYNRLSYPIAHTLRWLTYAWEQNEIRRTQLGLPSLSPSGFEALIRRTPSVTLVSEHIVPRPPDWHEWHHLTGFVFYDDDKFQPPSPLKSFIESGPPPVYIGFGSMHDRMAGMTTQLILDALDRGQQRAIIHRGWAGLGVGELPDDVFPVDYVPHGWLFPRMAAIVHHAGAGTSAAALRAGVPSVPVPHSGDQAFWARVLYARGAATRPLPRSRLRSDRLASRIALAVSDRGLRSGTSALGVAIRAEDGVGGAVAAIKGILG
jgi:sterol 3beta-glucosyltransferase